MAQIELPLFPLPVVVFPGTPQPLHIFEQRYRQLLADCLAGDGRFGVSVARGTQEGQAAPTTGDVGCTARIRSHYTMPDGRSNLLAIGEERYVFKELVRSDRLYFVGLVELFHDTTNEDSELLHVAGRLHSAFTELTRALQNETPGSSDALQLPDDPVQLSFHIAAGLNADLDIKEDLLRLTSTRVRLERLRQLVKQQTVDVAQRASVHRLAKGNGKRDCTPNLAGE
jgi:Lon protease-like protein